MNKGTYNRKYYLNRKIKKAGLKLEIEKTLRTIKLDASQIELAKENKYVRELQNQHQYGTQIQLYENY